MHSCESFHIHFLSRCFVNFTSVVDIPFEQAVTQAKDAKVEITVSKVVLLGPPEAGKTQLVSALLGDDKPVKYSTSFSTRAKLAVTRFVMKKGSVHLQTLTKDVFHQCLYGTAANEAKAGLMSHSFETHRELRHRKAGPFGPSQAVISDTISDDFFQLLVNVEDQCPVYDKEQTLKMHYVHLIDNGGQPAFFDAHPVVATSQATYLLVYNMQEGLDAKPQYTYRKRGYSEDEKQHSSIPNDYYSNLDLLQASLRTISNLSEKFLSIEKKMVADSQSHVPSVQLTGSSYVLVVGTRFGVEVPVKESVTTVDTDWEKKLSTAHSHLEKACKSVCSAWQYVHTCKVDGKVRCLFPVNSLNKGCVGVQAVCEKIADFGLKLRMSIKWFHCHLLFWHAKEERKDSGEKMYPHLEVLLFSKLFDLCKEHELVSNKEELLAMVRAFHVLGLFFFPALDQEEEEGWNPDDKPVFTNPDLLYGELTKILVIAFEEEFESPEGVRTDEDPKLFKQLKEDGELTSKIMGRLGIPDKLDAIPELDFHEYLLTQLSTWGLAAKLPASKGSSESGTFKEATYFVPCVLRPFHIQGDNPSSTDDPALYPTALCVSLTIYDKSTHTYYILNGAFAHFVVKLLQRGNAYERQLKCHGVQHCYSDSVDLVRNASDGPQQLKYEYFVRVANSKLESITVVITPRNPENKWAHDYYQIIWNELQPAMAEACEQMFRKKRSPEIIVATKCRCCNFCDSNPHLAKLRIAREDMECLHHSDQRNLQGFLLEVVKSSKGDLVYMHMCVYVYRHCV